MLYLIAFVAGLLSFISPCIIPMITVYFSLITGMSVKQLRYGIKTSVLRKHVIRNTLVFITSFTLVFTLAGGAAGKISGIFLKNIHIFNLIGGTLVILLGLNMTGIINFDFVDKLFKPQVVDYNKINTRFRYLTTFIIGVLFAVVCSHCIGPILYSIIIMAGATGSAVNGMLVMFVFSLGLGIPYLLVGINMDRGIKLSKRLLKYQMPISIALGLIMIVFGTLMLFNKFFIVTQALYKILPIKLPIGM